MKFNSLFSLLVLLSLSIVTLSSCGDDDDAPAGNMGTLTVSGTTYDTPNGFVLYDAEFDSMNNTYVHTVAFASEGVSIAANGDDFVGTGSGITFGIASASADALTAGTYSANFFPFDGIAADEFVGGFAVDIDFADSVAVENDGFLIVDGTVTLTANGDDFDFSYSGTATDRGVVPTSFSGSFEGTLEEQ